MTTIAHRYRLTTYQDRATITDTRTNRVIIATKQKGGLSYSGPLPATVKRATVHELNRSAY
jgi:hypothetical protein